MLALGLALLASLGAIFAPAAVPTFPNNLIIFPDRDFITVEGYQDHVGDTALIEVTRAGQVIGSAQGVVAAGAVAFEINHPGGVCWGNGTNLKVTPDIRGGDTATISFGGAPAGDTTVQDTYVTGVDYVPGASTFTIKGHVGAGVSHAQMEQRIVNPDLVTTAIARRDVRAVPGALTPAPLGGYSSGLAFAGDLFTATYVFDDPALAKIAATGGGDRIMGWQVEDAAANRQGLTISEFGELGGPGMGGCPAGPANQAAPQPGGAGIVRSSDKTTMQVTWTPAAPAPGAAPVTGYNVVAISQMSAAGQQVEIGRRTGPDATKATINGLTPGEAYDVEVRSIAGPRMSDAFTVTAANPAPGDTTLPTLAATPAPGIGVTEAKSVVLTSDPNADVYYTTDGSPAIAGGLPTNNAKLYAGPIAITAQTVLNMVAFDRAGNFSTLSGTYAPPVIPLPDAPTNVSGTVGPGSVTLKWTATDPSITGYGVQVRDSAGAMVGALRETADKSLLITGLAPGKQHFFTVKAKNATGWGAESVKAGPLTPAVLTDDVTIATARWKAADFRVTGTGSVDGATVTVRAGSPNGRALGSAAVVAGLYDVRLRNAAAPSSRPATVYVVSSKGGVAGPSPVG